MFLDSSPEISGNPFGNTVDTEAMDWIEKRFTVDSVRDMNISSSPLTRLYNR
ncbi:MAG: hypothetical protein BMS9Abin05_2491 [Rhodothermia bacterium]|nr:MAG: hypothetical protein BMS9Abin05_2491 [Rhodothermia bacterium]